MASSPQTSQRVRVGVIGLVSVLLLIALASTIFGSARRERPVAAPGGARPDVVANLAGGNEQAQASEPLADMGVSPGVQNEAATAR